MVTVEGFEPPTHGLEIRCSNPAELHRHKMEPPVGIEPTTSKLQISRSTGWAKVAL